MKRFSIKLVALVILAGMWAQLGFAQGDVAFEGDVRGTALMSTGAQCSLGEWTGYDSNYYNGTNSATATFRQVKAPTCDLWQLDYSGVGGGTVDVDAATAQVEYQGTLTTSQKPVPGSWDPRLVDGYHGASAYVTIWDEVSVPVATTLVIHAAIDSSGVTTSDPASMQPIPANVLASVDVSPADPFQPNLLYWSRFYSLAGSADHCTPCFLLGNDTQALQVNVPAGVVRISAHIRVDAGLRNAGLGRRTVDMAGAIGMRIEAPPGIELTSRDGLGGMARWNTPAGSNIAVSPAGAVDITFENVSQGGQTSASASPIGPTPPQGFQVLGSYYDLTTTAVFERAQVCLAVDPSLSPKPALLHYENGSWVDVTDASLGDASHVCGFVTSFSPFVLAREAIADDAPPELSCASADGAWHNDNVTLDCTAADAGSGLANASDTSFSLSTSVPAGSETASAATDTREVCDNAGNCATAGPIGGNKIDRKAPAISVPAGLEASASGTGAVVSYAASVSDGADPNPSLNCAPASGSMFPVGATTVTCSSSDHVGNASSADFLVTVTAAPSPSAAIVALIDKTLRYLDAPALRESMRLRLQAAADALAQGNRPAACRALRLYVLVVHSQSGRAFTPSEAAELVADARAIRDSLGCS